MKGIILAGGKSTRLYPLTKGFSKHFLPIYDKPMIYYPLSVLMLAGIKDILIICNPSEQILFESLFHDGKYLGISINYKIQSKPRGIVDAFIIGADFVGKDSVCLILGDNLFYGQDLIRHIQRVNEVEDNAVIFGYFVKDPSEYGVVKLDDLNQPLEIVEKPKTFISNYAIPGLYFYPNDVLKLAKKVIASDRGELEISSLNSLYLNENRLSVEILGRGTAWLDTGSPRSLLSASSFVEAIQSRQGLLIGSIEEIAWRKKFISSKELLDLAMPLKNTDYGKYLLDLVSNE